MKLMQSHIFLTGFMGSGKSTAGKKLASLLHLNFIDLDDYIELHEKKSITLIFDQDGEEFFRKVETKVLQEILNSYAPCVISLGGGTICFNGNLDLVKKNGLLVYLELPVTVLAERLKNSINKRPLLKQNDGGNLTKAIEEKLNQRRPFYEQAHITVNGLNLTAQLLYNKISEAGAKGSI